MSDKRANDLNLFTKDQDNYSIDTSKKLKVGIIGTGWIAESHISEYLKMPDVELVGVASTARRRSSSESGTHPRESGSIIRTRSSLTTKSSTQSASAPTT